MRRLGKGDDRPLNSLDDRMAVLAALAAVDLVVPFDADTPRDLIVACRPDVLVKGGDYTAASTAGAAETIAAGGRFVAIPFEFDRSTTRAAAPNSTQLRTHLRTQLRTRLRTQPARQMSWPCARRADCAPR